MRDRRLPALGARHRVLIVDDHPLVRAGIAALIGGEPDLEVCGEAGTFADALELARQTEPDLAIVDVSLANGSGLELVRRLTSGPRPPLVLVCSMHDESLFAQRALHSGARGYINKHEATSNVIEAVRRVLGGKIFLSGPMTERMLQGLAGGRSVRFGHPIQSLTDRELEVLSLIGRGLPTARIAGQLHVSVKTIETHRDKIKRKLNLDSGSELVRYAVQWTLEQG
jgi:DNA-binding NarL/FixJ family response regulator